MPVAPTIAAVDQSASILRDTRRRPVGITFSVALNEQAAVSFSFVQRSISTQRDRALSSFIRFYKRRRPHSAANGRAPVTRV
jgi:hypothetical protein